MQIFDRTNVVAKPHKEGISNEFRRFGSGIARLNSPQ